jgi:hypothetical protein
MENWLTISNLRQLRSVIKRSGLLLSLSILFSGLSLPSFAQIMLPEVKIVASTYKYLSAVDNKEIAQPVRMLQFKAAAFDVKKSEFYEDDYDTYYISFYIPEGAILASYDKEVKLLRTAQKFKNIKNIKLPKAVRNAVIQRFPNWHISQDVYKVNYYDKKRCDEKPQALT